MERQEFRIPEESKCIRGVVICGAVMLLMQFCWWMISWEAGEFYWDFQWRLPVDFHGEKLLLKSQINDLGIPVLLIVFGIVFAKRDPELMAIPLIYKLFGDFCWMLVEWIKGMWFYPEWLLGWFIRLVPLAALLVIFSSLMSGRLKRKGWLLAVIFGYLVFLVGNGFFTRLAGLGHETGFRMYVHRCLEEGSFYLAYGILGLALRDDPGCSYLRVGARLNPVSWPEAPRYTAYELLEEKNIAKCMVLSIITLKIYSWFWAYSIMKRIRYLRGEDPSCGGELLCFLFIPFYQWYWFYTRGGRMADGARDYGIYLPKRQGIYLLVLFLAEKNVALAMMQSELNEFARLKGKQRWEEPGEWRPAEEKPRDPEENFRKD